MSAAAAPHVCAVLCCQLQQRMQQDLHLPALLLQTTASIGDAKMPEDMQDYLARMNKQLEEMAAQHLQVSLTNSKFELYSTLAGAAPCQQERCGGNSHLFALCCPVNCLSRNV